MNLFFGDFIPAMRLCLSLGWYEILLQRMMEAEVDGVVGWWIFLCMPYALDEVWFSGFYDDEELVS